MDEDEINHSMDSNTSKQSNDNMILNNISNESEKKSNQNNGRKRSESNAKTRGKKFSKRESKTKLSQRRRSSGKKNRSFTPERVANIQTKSLPPTLSETNVQNNNINPYETEKLKRHTQNEIVAKLSKQSGVYSDFTYSDQSDTDYLSAQSGNFDELTICYHNDKKNRK